MELPSRNELRQKNLFSVADLRMTWHDQGHFLCVKVDKHSKSKKTLNSAFELFRLRDKGVPIEVQEFSKDLCCEQRLFTPLAVNRRRPRSSLSSRRQRLATLAR